MTLGVLRVVTGKYLGEDDGTRPATVADLVSALRAEGVLVVECKGCGSLPPEFEPWHWSHCVGSVIRIEQIAEQWPDGVVTALQDALIKRWAARREHLNETALAVFRTDAIEVLDALAEVQPFPPAGEPPKDPWDYDP